MENSTLGSFNSQLTLTSIQLRNRLLQLWLENPRQQLVASDAVGRLAPPWDSDKQLGNTAQPST